MSEWSDLNLAGARRRLEDTFAAYPARHRMAGCSCCVTPEDQAALAAGYIGRFAFKALTTWGDVDDFKHFLPRLLDHDLEQALDKLAYADWRTWPPREQRAIEEYLVALWEEQLATDEYPPAGELLLAMGRLGLDLRPHLEHWRRRSDDAALAQLVALINDDIAGSLKPTIYDLAAESPSAAQRTLLGWLLDPATAAALEAAFFAAHGPEAAEISEAIERLALLAQISR
jgi:hypothetical protein